MLATLLAQTRADIISRIPSAPLSAPLEATLGGGTTIAFAQAQRIDSLTNTTITTPTINSPTISGGSISGTSISGYLPTSGGTLTGALTGTDLTLSGNLTVSGAQTLSGAITIPYLTATSTTASSFVGAVGIGTTSPMAKFSIAANTNETNPTLFTISSSTLSATTTLFSVGNTGTISVNLDSSTSTLLALGGHRFLTASSSYSTSLGVNAMASAVSGGYSIAFGDYAMQKATQSWFDVAIGEEAMSEMLTGNGNVGIGQGAMANSTNLYASVAVGNYALADSGDKYYANAIGAAAGYGNNHKDWGGVYIGYATGYSLTGTSTYNMFIGHQAGRSITTGDNNILIGAHDSTANVITTGSNNVGLGNELWFASATASNQLNIGNILYGTLPATTTSFQLPTTGSIGVGTTTPWGRLSVLTANNSSEPQFVVGSSTAISLFVGANGSLGIGTTSPYQTLSVAGGVAFPGIANGAGTAYLCTTLASGIISTSTTACNPSSLRYKDDVQDFSYGLSDLLRLRPVTYVYKPELKVSGKQVGFIAEEVYPIMPEVVGLDTEGRPNNIDYAKFAPLLTKAIQEIAAITGTFKTNLVAWLGDAGNGIGEFFASRVHTKELCVAKSDGTEFCANGDQLAALAGAANAPATTPARTDTLQAPVIALNGNATSTLSIGDLYLDLGARIVSPAEDMNLGIQTFVGTTPIDQATIDTSAPATYHIYYVVTGHSGLTSTTTRTVIIQSTPTPQNPFPAPATSTPSSDSSASSTSASL